MRKWISGILFLAFATLFSCSRKEVSLLDAVPLNADVIVESSDSAVIMMFDSILSAQIQTEKVKNGNPMVLARVPRDEQQEFLLLTKPVKTDKHAEKIYDDPDFARLQKTLGQNVDGHLYYKDSQGCRCPQFLQTVCATGCHTYRPTALDEQTAHLAPDA